MRGVVKRRSIYVIGVIILVAGIGAWTGRDRIGLFHHAPDGMVWIPGGEFWMGSDFPMFRDARPVHLVRVDGFFMDKTEVTNEQFERFVKATGYVTVAERVPTPEEFPGAPPENLVAGSVVFAPPSAPVALNDHFQWWSYIKGADWRHPEGLNSQIVGKMDYPVVHGHVSNRLGVLRYLGRIKTRHRLEYARRGDQFFSGRGLSLLCFYRAAADAVRQSSCVERAHEKFAGQIASSTETNEK